MPPIKLASAAIRLVSSGETVILLSADPDLVRGISRGFRRREVVAINLSREETDTHTGLVIVLDRPGTDPGARMLLAQLSERVHIIDCHQKTPRQVIRIIRSHLGLGGHSPRGEIVLDSGIIPPDERPDEYPVGSLEGAR